MHKDHSVSKASINSVSDDSIFSFDLEKKLDQKKELSFRKKDGFFYFFKFKKDFLLLPAELKKIFNKNKKFSSNSNSLTFLYTKTELNYPKIGILLAKSKSKSAVQRNFIRRFSKELFRLNQHKISGISMIIIANSKTKKASKTEISTDLSQFFKYLSEKNTI